MNATNYEKVGNVTITDARETPQQVATEPATKPDKKARNADQEKLWKEGKDKAFNRMFPNSKEEKKEAPKADAKEKPTEKPAKETPKEPASGGEVKQSDAKPTEEPKPEPKATAKKEESAAPTVDLEKLAKSVAKETAEALTKKTEAKPEDDVPESRRRDLAAVDYLDSNNPKYKGAGAKYRKFAKDEAAFIAKWEAANPGESFDPDSSDHSAWYDKHEPDIDVDDLTEARVELTVEKRTKAFEEKQTASSKKEIEDLRRGIQIKDAESQVPAYVSHGVAVLAHSLGEDIGKKFSELKGDETLETSDPHAHSVIVETLPELQRQTVAAAHIFGTEGRAYDGKNADHATVAQSAFALQKEIQGWPEEKRTAGGRTFVTLDDWANMTDSQKSAHWTINAALISAYLAKKAGERASETYKKRVSEFEALAKARGFVRNGEAPKAEVAAEEVPTEREKPRSPSTSTSTAVTPGQKVVPKISKDAMDSVLDKMFRRS